MVESWRWAQNLVKKMKESDHPRYRQTYLYRKPHLPQLPILLFCCCYRCCGHPAHPLPSSVRQGSREWRRRIAAIPRSLPFALAPPEQPSPCSCSSCYSVGIRIPRVQITELLGLPHCKAASGDQALPLSSSIQRSGVETIRALQQASSICYKNKRRKHSNDNDVFFFFFFFFFCCNPENSQSASENRAGTLQEQGMRGRSRVHVRDAARVTEAALRWCFFPVGLD
jgi:hypothetical protein